MKHAVKRVLCRHRQEHLSDNEQYGNVYRLYIHIFKHLSLIHLLISTYTTKQRYEKLLDFLQVCWTCIPLTWTSFPFQERLAVLQAGKAKTTAHVFASPWLIHPTPPTPSVALLHFRKESRFIFYTLSVLACSFQLGFITSIENFQLPVASLRCLELRIKEWNRHAYFLFQSMTCDPAWLITKQNESIADTLWLTSGSVLLHLCLNMDFDCVCFWDI